MILSQPDLRAAVASGDIGFTPGLEETQWGEASIDLRLGFSFTKVRSDLGSLTFSVASGLSVGAGMNFWITKELQERDGPGKVEQSVLEPDEFVLALTYETVRVPKNLTGLVDGRSTYARMGISMHQTAPWIQPGWSGPIVLEIKNSGPLRIALTPKLDRPCQITFFELTSEVPKDALYGSRTTDRYQGQTHPLKHK